MQPNFKLSYSHPLRTEAIHIKSGSKIITDAPVDNCGKGESFSPTDLLVTSLISCALTIIGIASKEGCSEIISMEADVQKEMKAGPRRIGKISAIITITLKGADKKETERLERAGRSCPVAKSISSDIDQDLSFIFNLQK